MLKQLDFIQLTLPETRLHSFSDVRLLVSMEPQDYPIEHFRMMAEIAVGLKSIPAQILRSDYTYESFGSWWFTFRRSGYTFRVTFDGRDKYLNLERTVRKGSEAANTWQAVAGKQMKDASHDDIVSEVIALARS